MALVAIGMGAGLLVQLEVPGCRTQDPTPNPPAPTNTVQSTSNSIDRAGQDLGWFLNSGKFTWEGWKIK